MASVNDVVSRAGDDELVTAVTVYSPFRSGSTVAPVSFTMVPADTLWNRDVRTTAVDPDTVMSMIGAPPGILSYRVPGPGQYPSSGSSVGVSMPKFISSPADPIRSQNLVPTAG